MPNISIPLDYGDDKRIIVLPRWPLSLSALGWLVLVVAAVDSDIPAPPYLMPAVWGFGAATALVTNVALIIKPSEALLVYLLAITTVIGAARSIAYLVSGAWSPFGVWLIVVGLGFAYSLGRKRHSDDEQ